jgi:ABC-type nickel/cobalt efflux system permease component RcnA
VALTAAMIHVAMGFLAFLVLRLIAGQMPTMTARGSPAFALIGYGLILLAGSILIYQSLKPAMSKASPHMLTAGVGILPCPLTVTVLGFAWAQGSRPMVGVVLVALAAGIAFTIGIVAVLAIAGRRLFGHALMHRIPAFERGARALQGIAGAAIVLIASYALWANL